MDADSPPDEQSLLKRITVETGKCGGKPCIRGMRVRVIDILDMLAARMSREEILADFPYLENEDIDAALVYARESLPGGSAAAA